MAKKCVVDIIIVHFLETLLSNHIFLVGQNLYKQHDLFKLVGQLRNHFIERSPDRAGRRYSHGLPVFALKPGPLWSAFNYPHMYIQDQDTSTLTHTLVLASSGCHNWTTLFCTTLDFVPDMHLIPRLIMWAHHLSLCLVPSMIYLHIFIFAYIIGVLPILYISNENRFSVIQSCQ